MGIFQTPPQKLAKHPGGDRTGVYENRTKFNQEQARIINDGIYWMEQNKWTEATTEDDFLDQIPPKVTTLNPFPLLTPLSLDTRNFGRRI